MSLTKDSLELTGAGDGVGSSERRRDVTGLSRKKKGAGVGLAMRLMKKKDYN